MREQKPRDAVGLEGRDELSDVLTVLEIMEPPLHLILIWISVFPEVPKSFATDVNSPFGLLAPFILKTLTLCVQPCDTSAEIVNAMATAV